MHPKIKSVRAESQTVSGAKPCKPMQESSETIVWFRVNTKITWGNHQKNILLLNLWIKPLSTANSKHSARSTGKVRTSCNIDIFL